MYLSPSLGFADRNSTANWQHFAKFFGGQCNAILSTDHPLFARDDAGENRGVASRFYFKGLFDDFGGHFVVCENCRLFF